jgi:hypothetical protein
MKNAVFRQFFEQTKYNRLNNNAFRRTSQGAPSELRALSWWKRIPLSPASALSHAFSGDKQG